MNADETMVYLNTEERDALRRVLRGAQNYGDHGQMLRDIDLIQDRIDAAHSDTLADSPSERTATEHTAGPWQWVFITIPGSSNRHWEVRDKNGHVIAKSDVGPHAFNEANARLIAAAPETTAELENLLSWIEESFPREEDQPDLSGARAAIAKAREQS